MFGEDVVNPLFLAHMNESSMVSPQSLSPSKISRKLSSVSTSTDPGPATFDIHVLEFYEKTPGLLSYDNFYFKIEVQVDDAHFFVHRSYVDFVQLDLVIRRRFPRTTLPSLPFTDLEKVEKAILLKQREKLKTRSPTLQELFSSKAQSFDPHDESKYFRADDFSDNLTFQVDLLNVYLTKILCFHELVVSEEIQIFFDEEILILPFSLSSTSTSLHSPSNSSSSIPSSPFSSSASSHTSSSSNSISHFHSPSDPSLPSTLNIYDLLLKSETPTLSSLGKNKEHALFVGAGSVLVYKFVTSEYEIGFSLEMNGEGKVPYSLVPSHQRPICGSIEAHQNALCKLKWDNSFAYLRTKQLLWLTKVVSNEEYQRTKQHLIHLQSEKRRFEGQRHFFTRACSRHATHLSGGGLGGMNYNPSVVSEQVDEEDQRVRELTVAVRGLEIDREKAARDLGSLSSELYRMEKETKELVASKEKTQAMWTNSLRDLDASEVRISEEQVRSPGLRQSVLSARQQLQQVQELFQIAQEEAMFARNKEQEIELISLKEFEKIESQRKEQIEYFEKEMKKLELMHQKRMRELKEKREREVQSKLSSSHSASVEIQLSEVTSLPSVFSNPPIPTSSSSSTPSSSTNSLSPLSPLPQGPSPPSLPPSLSELIVNINKQQDLLHLMTEEIHRLESSLPLSQASLVSLSNQINDYNQHSERKEQELRAMKSNLSSTSSSSSCSSSSRLYSTTILPLSPHSHYSSSSLSSSSSFSPLKTRPILLKDISSPSPSSSSSLPVSILFPSSPPPHPKRAYSPSLSSSSSSSSSTSISDISSCLFEEPTTTIEGEEEEGRGDDEEKEEEEEEEEIHICLSPCSSPSLSSKKNRSIQFQLENHNNSKEKEEELELEEEEREEIEGKNQRERGEEQEDESREGAEEMELEDVLMILEDIFEDEEDPEGEGGGEENAQEESKNNQELEVHPHSSLISTSHLVSRLTSLRTENQTLWEGLGVDFLELNAVLAVWSNPTPCTDEGEKGKTEGEGERERE